MHDETLPAHVIDVTHTARRYGRVLLSRRMWRALAVATLSGAFTLLIAVGVIPAVIMLTAREGERLSYGALALALLFLLLVVGLPADMVVAEDARPAVLFLRSLETEHVPLTGARLPWVLRGSDPGAEHGSLEEMIVLGMTYLSPVVAVADPSQPDLPVGAARWRLGDDEWQRFVETQIARAGCIVVGLAETSGLWWEIDALKRSPGALDKTIFVSPPSATRNRDLLGRLTARIGSSTHAGDPPTAPPHDPHLIACAVVRDSPNFFVTSALSEAAYYVALRTWLVSQTSDFHSHR